MRFPTRISFYMGAQFLLWLGVGLLVFTSLIFLVDSVEVLRRSAARPVPYSIVLAISFLHLPTLLEQIAPFTFLFGALLCFTKLTRTRELVITRASGISVWQFLLPSLTLSMLIGVFIICFFNPLGAMMNARAAQLEDKYFQSDTSSLINFSKSGLWLKQRGEDNDGETLITAASISPDSQHFRELIIFEFDKNKNFTRRIDAEEGTLANGQWALTNAIINKPGIPTQKLTQYSMPTSLSLKQIQDSFNSPDTISFWALPDFIKALEESGFSALRHKLYYHSILTTPIMLATMVLIAAVFSLRFSRRGNGLLISGGVFTGFVFFFFSKLTASFGVAGDMPIILAAWTPTLIFILIGIWLLLHLEDG